MAPIVLRMREQVAEGAPIEYRVCVTGQHRGLLDQVLSVFGIVADYDLDIMRAGQQLIAYHYLLEKDALELLARRV